MNKVKQFKRKEVVDKICKRCKTEPTTSGNAVYCYSCKVDVMEEKSRLYSRNRHKKDSIALDYRKIV